jgi:L-asparagine permease
VPAGGITITASLGLIGVLINYVYPSDAFEIVMNLAGIGIAGTWISILVSHILFVRKARRGELERPDFQLRGAPVTNVVAVVFLLTVIVSMWFDPSVGRRTIYMFLVVVALLVIGWFAVRNRINGALLDTILDEDDAASPSSDTSPSSSDPASRK